MTFLSDSAWNPEQLLAIVPAVVFETRLNFRDGKFVVGYVNQTVATLLGLDPASFDLEGFSLEGFMGLVHPGDVERLHAAIAEATEKVARFHEQCRLMLPDGTVRWIDMVADPEPFPDAWMFWRGVATDITALKQADAERLELQNQLEHMATHDALTGLPNRLSFERRLREACDQARQQREHALCFMDLDRFKIVNDSAGHAAGDAFLRLVGDLLRTACEGRHFTARLGGDEFALLLYDCSLAKAEHVARELIAAIGAIRLSWDRKIYDIGASIGVTPINARSPKPPDLMSQADVACYAAKSSGRNQVTVYGARNGAAERHHHEILIASGIREAIEADRLQLFAQEILTLKSGAPGASPEMRPEMRNVELLLRMTDTTGRVLRPGAFIPAAERYDLMGSLDRWVIENALIEHGEALAAIGDLAISINLSANSINDPLFWPFLKTVLEASRLPPAQVTFEITETALIDNIDTARAFMTTVRRAGHALILDDFGTGLSSFNYLKQFPVDGLKIDGSFIRQLKENAVDRVIVEAINEIAHKLGMKTVAEFVEDAETLDIVRAIGIDQAQGYVIGRPVPLDMMIEDHAARRVRLI
jgi:diguanylate cyclase (GGDEF)-like protein